jgi:hypothetical protein
MIRPEHQFDIRPDLRKAASTKAESTTAESVIRPKQLVRAIIPLPSCPLAYPLHGYALNEKKINDGKQGILDIQ